MRQEDDPFLSLMRFLEGKTDHSKRVSKALEDIWESFICNIIWVFFLFLVLFIALAFASPILLSSDNQTLTNAGAFAHVLIGILGLCHQLPYRSLMWGTIPFPLCARCLGIYAGAISGFATIALIRPPKQMTKFWFPILAAIPISIDGVTQTIMLLRESNNALRILTGFIFSFGILAYLANSFLRRWHPSFPIKIRKPFAVFFDSMAALFLFYLVLAVFAAEIGTDYMTVGQARSMALSLSSIDNPVQVKAFFISSTAALSILADPYYPSHRGNVMDMVREADFSKDRIMHFSGEKVAQPMPDNATLTQMLSILSERDHRLGIWAVAVLEEEAVKKDASFIESGAGQYYLFDGFTGQMILEKRFKSPSEKA